jgi:hypothetical protein
MPPAIIRSTTTPMTIFHLVFKTAAPQGFQTQKYTTLFTSL